MNGEHFFSLEQPLHALPAGSQVSALNLHRFPTLVESLGGDSIDIMERHGFDVDILAEDTHFLDCQAFVDMFEYCARQLNDPLFGIHLAQIQDIDIYGCVSTLCRSASTVRQGIHGLIEYLPVVHSSESILELVEGGATSELRWTEQNNFGCNDQADVQGLMLNLKVLRSLAGNEFAPNYVNVSKEMYQRAGKEIERTLRCPVRASSERSCIALPTALLDQFSVGRNHPLYELLSAYLERLKNFQNPSLKGKVHEFIRAGMQTGNISIESCARQLGLSSRVLQMRLKFENLSYSDILDQHRLEMAKSKLRNPNIHIAEIADLLGYAERTSFGRAFKRWTDMSPQQFRSLQNK